MSMVHVQPKPESTGFFPFESRRSTPNFRKPAMISNHEAITIEYMWWLYNALPRQRNRLDRAYDATMRLIGRKRNCVLPPRAAFTTTVDYYEAILPLLKARAVFRRDFLLRDSFLSLSQACKTIVPEELF